MKTSVSKENWLLNQFWWNWNQNGKLGSTPFYCVTVLEALFLYANGYKVKNSQVFEKYLLVRVFNCKRVLLVKKSFPCLTNIHWVNVVYLFCYFDLVRSKFFVLLKKVFFDVQPKDSKTALMLLLESHKWLL